MTPDDIRQAVLEELANIAPDADLAALAGDAELRDALDIDSMDFLNLVIALHKRLGIEIAERDYGQVQSLDAIVGYLAARRQR
jgi:acyl carrier protein